MKNEFDGVLILSRYEGETIHLNDDIIITLLKSQRGVAKIAIRAPKDVEIWRGELYEKIKTQRDAEKIVAALEKELKNGN